MAATHKRYPPKTDFSDQTITNVQEIQLKTIVSDDDTSVSLNLGTDSGDDFKVATDKLAVKGDTGNVGIGTASPGTSLQVEGSEPYVTLKNSTAENGEGGCEAKVIFEDHANAALAQIEGSHSGTADDTKGKLILSTHTGSALTTALTINDTQQITIPGDVVFDNKDNAGKDMTWDVSEDSLILNDDVQLSCGTDRDLRLYHTGTHAYMNVVTGDLNIRTNGSESAIVCTSNAGVATYYDNSKKTETTSTGITVTGTLVADNLDIGTDVDVDGTLEADAVTVGGVALNTVIAGVTVTNATNAAHVAVADNESTNENNLITFIEDTSATGNVGLESDGDFHYNPSTGTVTATIFKGNIDAVDVDVDGTLETDNLTIGGAQGSDGQVLTSTGSGVGWEDAGGGGGYTVEAKSAGFTAAVDYYYVIDSSGGAIAVALPNAGATTSGKTIGLKARHGAVNAVTLNRAAGGSIDGVASNYIINQNMVSLELICDGSNWWIK